MKAAIKERLEWLNKRLDDLTMAQKTFSSENRCYAYAMGRIRELENEKVFLDKILKAEENHAGRKSKMRFRQNR